MSMLDQNGIYHILELFVIINLYNLGRFYKLQSTTSTDDLKNLILNNDFKIPTCCNDVHDFS